MKELLYMIVGYIAKAHTAILKLNDKFEYDFNDKELHFIVIGAIGMMLVLVIYPLFDYLIRKKKVLTLTWIYVFTLIVVLTFAIEIGQKITGTGKMEFYDIAFGVVGFIVMFAIFAVLQAFVMWVKKKRKIKHEDEQD